MKIIDMTDRSITIYEEDGKVVCVRENGKEYRFESLHKEEAIRLIEFLADTNFKIINKLT